MGMIYGSIRHTPSGRKKKALPKSRATFRGTASTAPRPYRREVPEYPSVPTTTALTPRPEPKRYTGTLVKGIGTMHKSNAVPVIDEQEMKDLASMRR